MIRVVLADDQALVRSGLRALLANSDDIQVVGEASDGREAVAVVTRTQARCGPYGCPDAWSRRNRSHSANNR